MRHIPEEDLIAFQMRESHDEGAIREHLEVCEACAAVSESIGETLRVYSAEPVPQANLEHAWQRLRGSLPVLAPAPRRHFGLRLPTSAGPVFGMFGAALLLVIFMTMFVGVRIHRGAQRPHADLAFHRPGPLTEQPTDPTIANHLDSAERLLTEVNHASGPLDETTRSQAHDLLLKNAVYMHKAHDQGDLAEASVLENLGRVLTTLDHEPALDRGWHIRFEMNTDGLLLDIRVLRQNDARQ